MAIFNVTPSHTGYEGDVGDINPLNKVVYVAASGGNDNATGEDPTAPLATLLQGVTNALAGGTIVLGPGTHSVDVSATLDMLANQTVIGAQPSYGGKPSSIITGVGDDAVMVILVDVSGVVFKNLTFLQLAGAGTLLQAVAIGETTAVNSCTFSECTFDLNQVAAATIGIASVDATNATKNLTIDRCSFIEADTTSGGSYYIKIGAKGAPHCRVTKCIFHLAAADASTRGIHMVDPAGSVTSYGVYFADNDFVGPFDAAADGIGIELDSSGEELETVGIITRNYIAGSAANPITKDQGGVSTQMGNFRADGSGGAATFDSTT